MRNALGNGAQFIGDIKYVSAAKSSGSAFLAGNENIDNVITASKGNSTVWGGGASDDTLIGGDGVDKFYYMLGNGNDVVQKASASDVVVLNGVEMSNITSTSASSSGVTLNFIDGGSLTVQSNAGTTFRLGDESGAAYTVDSSNNWTQK